MKEEQKASTVKLSSRKEKARGDSDLGRRLVWTAFWNWLKSCIQGFQNMKWAFQKQDDENALEWGRKQKCTEIHLTSTKAFIKVSRRKTTTTCNSESDIHVISASQSLEAEDKTVRGSLHTGNVKKQTTLSPLKKKQPTTTLKSLNSCGKWSLLRSGNRELSENKSAVMGDESHYCWREFLWSAIHEVRWNIFINMKNTQHGRLPHLFQQLFVFKRPVITFQECNKANSKAVTSSLPKMLSCWFALFLFMSNKLGALVCWSSSWIT